MDSELYALGEQVGAALKNTKLVLTTAESCTGGWIGEVVTMIAGSSAWYDRGFIPYTNAAKQQMLGVKAITLREHGAVSEPVVREMVAGALAASRAHIAVSVSGVAGPKTSEGLDLSATLRNPATPARTSLMFAYQKVQRSLRDERYKLIRYPQVDRTQLFDLVADPAERTDLSARPEHAARITAMTAALAVEMKRVDDPAELTVASPRPAAWSPPPARVKK